MLPAGLLCIVVAAAHMLPAGLLCIVLAAAHMLPAEPCIALAGAHNRALGTDTVVDTALSGIQHTPGRERWVCRAPNSHRRYYRIPGRVEGILEFVRSSQPAEGRWAEHRIDVQDYFRNAELHLTDQIFVHSLRARIDHIQRRKLL